MLDTIRIVNARLNNLKNISLDIPRHQLVVVTGLSGSGKSTLVFDTLFQESQRLFMGAQGVVSEGLQKPSVDVIEGLSPAIAIDQHAVNRNPRSTVGTASDVYTYLRILYARIGHRPCPECGHDVPPFSRADTDTTGDYEAEDNQQEDESADERCPQCGAQLVALNMSHFSFNVPTGACPTCTGMGHVREPKLASIVDMQRSVQDDGILVWDKAQRQYYLGVIKHAERYYGFTLDTTVPIGTLGAAQRTYLLYGPHSWQFRQYYPTIEPPAKVAQGHMEGIIPNILRRYEQHVDDAKKEEIEQYLTWQICSTCQGERLRASSRAVQINSRSIAALSQLSLLELAQWLEALPDALPLAELHLSAALLPETLERVRRLISVGVGYLTLDRDTRSLSGGEAQRIRLASLLGSGLTGILYILDEPTLGLHPRDTAKLIHALQTLRDLGNTVVVVEHDLDVIRAADYLIELGPGAGVQGGEVVATGDLAAIIAHPRSITGKYLSGERALPRRYQHLPSPAASLTIRGARAHNLQGVTVSIPLERLVAISGVSGSGKSSLVLDILGNAALQRLAHTQETPGEYESIEGWEHVTNVVVIDQAPLGRNSRSSPVTYCNLFTPIRTLFAETRQAVDHQLSARDFSFNVSGGRCERCEGAGVLEVHMYFLPPTTIRCPVCQGHRFKRKVLDVHYRDHTIAQVLAMTIRDAQALFSDIPAIAPMLALLVEVGLGYLGLGQPVTTLSGGEAQRIKLAHALARRSKQKTLYILDEPTVGLHIDDTMRLLQILQRLVESGNTVLVIEHDLEVIHAADWVIDLGPDGGRMGGQIVAQGTPDDVAHVDASFTGQFLRARTPTRSRTR